MPVQTLHYDDLLRQIGEFGKYQRFQFFLVCLVSITSSFHSMNMVFVGPTPKHRCKSPDVPEQWENCSLSAEHKTRLMYPYTDKMTPHKCKMYNVNDTYWDSGNFTSWINSKDRNTSSCTDGWVYDRDIYKSTIVSEWDLVCSNAWQRNMASSVFFAGRFVGAFSGQLSDRLGRRPVFFVSVILQVVVGCAAGLSPTLWFFYILYFLQGVFQVSVYLSSYVLGTELVGPSYRKLTGMASCFFYAIGQMLLTLIAYGIRDWRWIEVSISLPPLLFILYYWLMPESIRWLLSVGKRQEAAKIIDRASKMNGVQLQENVIDNIYTGTRSGENTKHHTLIDLVRRWRTAKVALNVWFNWLVNALVYYGISLNTSKLAGDPYLNFFIAACVEIPSLLVAILLLDRLGRKRIYAILLVIAATGCLTTAFVPKGHGGLATGLAMVGKFGITGSYAVIYLMAAEVFPTVVRNVGVGMSSASARIGGMVAPQVVLLGHLWRPMTQITFGVFAILAIITAIFLPETAGKNLANDLDDMGHEGNEKSLPDYSDNKVDLDSAVEKV